MLLKQLLERPSLTILNDMKTWWTFILFLLSSIFGWLHGDCDVRTRARRDDTNYHRVLLNEEGPYKRAVGLINVLRPLSLAIKALSKLLETGCTATWWTSEKRRQGRTGDRTQRPSRSRTLKRVNE
jgi:hypothetical protein